MANLENSIALLAEHHQAFQLRTADPALYDLADSHAEMLQADVAASIALLGELVSSYPQDTGMDTAVLHHLGQTLRLLGAVGCFAGQERSMIATARELPAKKGGRK
ncbi:hypothetical protein [Chromobacterium amazonense]|uniref:hypothetical protein n=1 Tax=Chromobacterium amazonense TaxID=1382803 RepID=UPI003F7909DC